MGDFKQQFNNTFKEAPSFSMQARNNVKRQLQQQKKRRWKQYSIVVATAIALVSFFIWNDALLGLFTEQSPISQAAPEHEDKMEIFSEMTPDNETQFAIKNTMNSMNRGNGEYVGDLVIESKFDEIEYGQVLMIEDGRIDDAFRYVVGRVIGKPGDKIAILDGQLYLNDLPIETFYGKAQIMGTTDVEEAFERLSKASSREWEETIEEALHATLEPFTLNEGELFIVSDSWARNSVRKTYTIEQVEGVVLGYSVETPTFHGWRKMNEQELAQITSLSEQLFEGIRKQDHTILEMVSSEHFSIPDPDNDINSIFEIDLSSVSGEIVDHHISYYMVAHIGNSVIGLNKSAVIGYNQTDDENSFYLVFVDVDGEWKLASYMFE